MDTLDSCACVWIYVCKNRQTALFTFGLQTNQCDTEGMFWHEASQTLSLSLPIRVVKLQLELQSDRWTLWLVNSHFHSSNCFNSLAISFLSGCVSNHFWQNSSLWSQITSSFVFYTFRTWYIVSSSLAQVFKSF